MNSYNGTVDNKWFGGTALAIAYTSDVDSLQPNDMTVISVNFNSVWEREISYSIPAGLPACPAGGCLCTWNWIHQGGHGEGYPFEIYNNLYRCTVTGATGTKKVQRGAVPVDCTLSPSSCVKGPKTPMYLYQADGNNLPHLDTPPLYRSEWGFTDGAQNDIFTAASTPAPSGTGGYAATATALPSGWTALGCMVDDVNKRALDGGAIDIANNTIAACTSYCASKGYNYAGVEYGYQCWCGKSATLTAADSSTCNVACPGDVWSMCGGSSRLNVFRSPSAPTTTVTPSAFPTASLPSGWKSLGCNVDSGDKRVLNKGSTTSANNTIPSCIASCAKQGFAYAGVEYGVECWCGTAASLSPATDGCNVPCAGDAGSFCGGSYRINVFSSSNTAVAASTTTVRSTTSTSAQTSKAASSSTATIKTSTTTFKATSTTTSKASSTTTSKASSSSTKPLVTSSSSAKATLASSSSAAVKTSSTSSGRAATTSSAKPSTSSAKSTLASSSTTKPATTSTAAKPSTSTTAKVSSSTVAQAAASSSASALPSGWESLGCYVDTTPRILNSTFANDNQNTYARCIARCAAQGYKYAGVEYGEQCMCGNIASTATLKAAPTTQCNVACKGDAKAMCGGSWRVNLFHLKDSSTVPRSLPIPEGVKWTRRRRGMWRINDGDHH
ncbi:hypothetical protein I316_00689 [Kwoniella heveanensis BCC8398]|uniref:WSC domain-containing protein n=1 Tax=Kwoniella heveanensis BCC8398 TaxID=1296120 RepID=A0A1B9H2R7_9TREE|nr:hypothetical protein I316_00689 [Kwoniella heveanensis BCC8398]